MPAGLENEIRLTTRELCGPGCWVRLRLLITRSTEIGWRHRVFWSRWEEAFIRLDLEASVKFLVAMRHFRRRGVLPRRGAWRRLFEFGNFWRGSWKLLESRKRLNAEAAEKERRVR